MTTPQNPPDPDPADPQVPTRRLNRRRLLRLMGGGVLALTTGGALRSWRVLQEPAVMFPTAPLPRPNAFDIYMKAVKQIVQADEIGKVALPSATPSKNARVLTIPEKQSLLQANRMALATFREGLRLDYHEPPARDDEALFPHYQRFRTMAKLLVLESSEHFRQGDLFAGVHSCLDAVQLGQDIPRGGPLITRLVGIACQAIGRRPLWKQIDSLNAVSASAGARRMETLMARQVPMAETLTEEKYFGQTALLKSFRDKNKMAGDLFPESDEGFTETPPQASLWKKIEVMGVYTVWSKERLMRDYSGYMDALIAESKKPYAQAQAPKVPYNPLLVQTAPIFDQARLKDSDSGETQNALLCAALALQAFRAEHKGAYPDTLAELVTGRYLSRVPIDPFSPDGRTPLRYRKTAGGMLLYSVGPDGKDDNGSPVEDKIKTDNARYFVTSESRGDLVAGTNIF